MFSFYRIIEALDQLDEYRWERRYPEAIKNPSVSGPLKVAKGTTTATWRMRKSLRNPEKVSGMTRETGLSKAELKGAFKNMRKIGKSNQAAAHSGAQFLQKYPSVNF